MRSPSKQPRALRGIGLQSSLGLSAGLQAMTDATTTAIATPRMLVFYRFETVRSVAKSVARF
jgi:hypothetical protein